MGRRVLSHHPTLNGIRSLIFYARLGDTLLSPFVYFVPFPTIGSVLSKTAAGPGSASTYIRGSAGLRMPLFICFFSTLTGVVADGVGLVFIPCTFLFLVLGRSNMHSSTFLQDYQAHEGLIRARARLSVLGHLVQGTFITLG